MTRSFSHADEIEYINSREAGRKRADEFGKRVRKLPIRDQMYVGKLFETGSPLEEVEKWIEAKELGR